MSLVLNETQRLAAWGDPCVAGDVDLVSLVLDGRTFQVNTLGLEAFQMWETIRAQHDYKLTGTDTGFYNCRHMRHKTSLPWSVHAWAMALDVNWLENPAGNKLVTDIPQAMIDDLLAVRTGSGERVFRWGGDWDWDGESTDHSYLDAMHWEVVAHPSDLASGIIGDDMPLNDADLAAIRGLIVDVLGGDRILMPKVSGETSDRYGNQGAVNSVWHATDEGRKLFKVLSKVPEDTADEIAGRLEE
jgi:hypothetical protein